MKTFTPFVWVIPYLLVKNHVCYCGCIYNFLYIDDVISCCLICFPCLFPTFLNPLPNCNGYNKWITFWCMFSFCFMLTKPFCCSCSQLFDSCVNTDTYGKRRFLSLLFFLGLPSWLDTSIVSSSGSVCCTLSVSFDRRRRFRRTPVRAYCFVASRAHFTLHLEKTTGSGDS